MYGECVSLVVFASHSERGWLVLEIDEWVGYEAVRITMMLKTSSNGKESCFFTIEVSEYHLRLSPLFSSTIHVENHDRLASQEHLFVSSFAMRYLPIIDFACAELHTRTAGPELTRWRMRSQGSFNFHLLSLCLYLSLLAILIL